MKTPDDLARRARELADELQTDISFQGRDGDGYGGYWVAKSQTAHGSLLAKAATALEFLNVYAGPTSVWYERAKAAYDSSGGGKSFETGVHAIGEILMRWATDVESGFTNVRGEVASGARTVASTDVMEQVRALLSDKNVHPAAPIVLAGAALETALKGLVAEAELDFDGKGSIGAYAKVLRSNELISKQEMKDIEQMGGLRNSAAHGDFEDLSRERAGLMEQQVNYFLSRVSERFDH